LEIQGVDPDNGTIISTPNASLLQSNRARVPFTRKGQLGRMMMALKEKVDLEMIIYRGSIPSGARAREGESRNVS
jgi:hypothetical protein